MVLGRGVEPRNCTSVKKAPAPTSFLTAQPSNTKDGEFGLSHLSFPYHWETPVYLIMIIFDLLDWLYTPPQDWSLHRRLSHNDMSLYDSSYVIKPRLYSSL